MKTSLLFSAAFFASLSAHAQGTVNFSNLGLHANVIDLCMRGAPAEKGERFSVGLYFAPDGITDPAQFRLAGDITHMAFPGLYSGGIRTVDITPPGFFAMFQVRVWESAYGSSYEEALNAPSDGRGSFLGESLIIRVDTGDPTTMPPGTPGSLKGISQIEIYNNPECTPEPSSIVLGIFGILILWLTRTTKLRQ